jgi:hypothetical protein
VPLGFRFALLSFISECGLGDVLRARRTASSRIRAVSFASLSFDCFDAILVLLMVQRLNLNLTPAQLEAIGSFATQWTFLETEIEFTISCFGAAVEEDQTVPFPFDDKIKRWKKLVKAHFSGDAVACDRYEKVIAVAKSAQENRSILLHGRTEGDPKKKTKTLYVEHHKHRRDGWHVQPYHLPIKLVRGWGKRLAELNASLIALNRIYLPGTPYTLPRKFDATPSRSAPRPGKTVLTRKPRLSPSRG